MESDYISLYGYTFKGSNYVKLFMPHSEEDSTLKRYV